MKIKQNIFLVPILISLGLITLNGCKESKAGVHIEKKEKIRYVKAFRLNNNESFKLHNFPGLIVPEKEIKLSFRVGGPIVQMSLETGQKIKKGETLAQIDERDFIVKIKNLSARVDASRAKLKDAAFQYNRYKALVKENAASKSKFDHVESLYLSSIAVTQALEKELENAKNEFKDTKLKSPVTGYINKIFTENHEIVANGQPIISIVQNDNIEVKAYIPEDLISNSENFQDFSFSVGSDNEKFYQAELKEMGEKATGPGNTYELTLKSETMDSVKPGMSATVKFRSPISKSENLFTIPISAVLSRDYQTAIVWKINKTTKKPQKAEIKIHKILDLVNVQVSGDLTKGDLLITSGRNYIDENSKIRLIETF